MIKFTKFKSNLMGATNKQTTGLNPLQLSLLRLFNRPMTDDEIISLRRVMVQHFNEQLQIELEKVVNEKGYIQDDFDSMLLGH